MRKGVEGGRTEGGRGRGAEGEAEERRGGWKREEVGEGEEER